MPFYVYIPSGQESVGGEIGPSHPTREEAEKDREKVGGYVIETPRPNFAHALAWKEKGFTKCESCGRPTPPWRQKAKVNP